MSDTQNGLVTFVFDTQEIRTIIIDGEPWFVAKDVCDVLGYQNPSKAISDHLDEDEYSNVSLGYSGPGNPNVNIISESGLYTLIIRSNKAQAKPFRRWVTSEVLPAIRKTGRYVHPRSVPPLRSSREERVDMAFTREGERVLRELRIGMGAVRCLGLSGRRAQAEKGASMAASRLGFDPWEYLGVDLDEYFPLRTGKGSGSNEHIAAFLASGMVEQTGETGVRTSLKHLHTAFAWWYRLYVNEKLVGLPPAKTLSNQLRLMGCKVEKRGGCYWAFGIFLINEEQIKKPVKS